METKFSKGKWEVCETNPNLLLINNSIVDFSNSSIGSHSKIHNARLCASAPELLEALNEAMIHFSHAKLNDATPKVIQMMANAIQKAIE